MFHGPSPEKFLNFPLQVGHRVPVAGVGGWVGGDADPSIVRVGRGGESLD